MHKSGFINIIGNPNVGKSTLTNAFVGEKLSIITAKAQTTRHRILGLVNGEDYQAIFSDTPGIIQPAYALQEAMMESVKTAFDDADVMLFLVEAGERQLKDEKFFKRLQNSEKPLLIAINKIDLTNQETLENLVEHWQQLFPKAEIWSISALEHFNTEALFQRLIQLLPESPPYFPKDQLTDRSERFIVNENIREKILMHYAKEIPYAVEVITEAFEESDHLIKIQSTILVERDTQKGIIIGHKGAALKKVGMLARKDLEIFFDKKIHLELYVKVDKNWRSNQKKLSQYGYTSKS